MKPTRVSILLSLCVVLVLASGCSLIDNLKARHSLNKGVKAFKDKAYDDAVLHFQAALELDPSLEVAYDYLATTYMYQYVPNLFSERNLKVASSAIEMFKIVIERQPDNKGAYQRIAQLYYQTNEYDEARDWYRKLNAIDVKNPIPLYGIGVIDWNIVHQATGPNGEYVPNLSAEEKAELMVTIEDGITVLQQALELDPEYADAMSFLNLSFRKKAMLLDDEDERNEYVRQADRLAAKSLIIKRQQQEQRAQEARKIF